ncbi:MaoC family dehydratase N-terminal domain-containing protein [Phytohabitans sp. ZYX-F-186]|uniref:MaoC family dehydratase N-terminal domain-containing protein n=1 Tax=Phytohabitans maris TaxID=3071409 RepID=A0ABU0ZQQ8_9ACTN|nr:MaoC family dehydratase N-terminal domain-containing protein [Phytohabitans sp. ZYX-F-186]MDQ7909357.1 MaoC family dehydratase N-terminal domain-containing protein [Phytohabitans sp. ZYX-F-186]
MTSYVSDRMRAALGEVVDWRVSFPISASDIRRWAVAVYYPEDPPREFWDADFADRERGGIAAPAEFNPFAWLVADQMKPAIRPERRDPDRLEKAIGIPGPGLRHQINGGTEAVYGVPMRPADVITSVTRLGEYRERTGRLGRMLITVTEVAWTNQRGETVRTGRDTSIRY